MKKYIYILLVVILPSFSIAQTSSVKGKVIDAATKKGIDLASVVLKLKNDTSKVYGAKTKEDGTFEIKNVPYNNYFVDASSIGYSKKNAGSININSASTNLKTIELFANSKSLSNVLVTAEKNDITLEVDKKVFNVEKNLTTAGGTAVDALRNVPSVSVDMDGNLSLRGKENVTLYIDGKPSAMFGSDPQTALSSIPASSIENVEIITNPSSKYEAQGMSGIINIVLKKDRKAGFNGMLTLGAGSPFRANGGLNLNANVKKWNFFFNGNTRTSNTWEQTTAARDNYENNLTYSSFNHNDRRPLNGFVNFGTEYTINNRNKITLTQNIFNAKMKGDSKTTNSNEKNYTDLISRQIRENEYTGNPLSGTTNLQYKHNFKKPKEEINFELNFSKMRYRRESNFFNSAYDSNDVFVSNYQQENPVLGQNWNVTFQVDYVKPIGKTAKIELGEKSYFIKFKSENQPTITLPGQATIEETILKNHFVFNQQLHGAYINYANQFNKTGVQLGVRGEYFLYEGTIYQYNASASNGYLNFFPTLFVTQKISSHEDLNFNYARRVNRPGFRQLIPFIDVSNPQDTSVGNPNLKSEFIHAMELTYSNQYKNTNTLMGSVYYQYTNDLIQRFRRYNNDGTTYSQQRNLASGITYGAEITNKMNILSWWDATLNLNVFRNIIKGNNIDSSLNNKGFGGFAKLVTNTRLKYGFNFQLTGNYYAKTVIAQGYVDPYSNIDLALKKSFLKNMVTLTANVTDVFNTLQTNTIYNYFPFYNQNILRKNQTRGYSLNLQVKFASKSQRSNPTLPTKKVSKKDKEGKNRDENLKKDDEGGEEGGEKKKE